MMILLSGAAHLSLGYDPKHSHKAAYIYLSKSSCLWRVLWLHTEYPLWYTVNRLWWLILPWSMTLFEWSTYLNVSVTSPSHQSLSCWYMEVYVTSGVPQINRYTSYFRFWICKLSYIGFAKGYDVRTIILICYMCMDLLSFSVSDWYLIRSGKSHNEFCFKLFKTIVCTRGVSKLLNYKHELNGVNKASLNLAWKCVSP